MKKTLIAAGAAISISLLLTAGCENSTAESMPVTESTKRQINQRHSTEQIGNKAEVPEVITVEQGQLPADETVVAALDGQEITIEQLKWMNPNLGVADINNMANILIEINLVYEEALERGVGDLDKAEFLADLEAKKQIAGQLVQEVRQNVNISDADLKEYYEENKATSIMLKEPMMLSFSHVTVKSRKEADEVLGRVKAGEDIGELAKELSVDSDSEKAGAVRRQQERSIKSKFGDELLAALLEVSEGDIVGPVKVKQGFAVARHEGLLSEKIKPFDEVKDSIQNTLIREKGFEAQKELIENVKQKAEQRIEKAEIVVESSGSEK